MSRRELRPRKDSEASDSSQQSNSSHKRLREETDCERESTNVKATKKPKTVKKSAIKTISPTPTAMAGLTEDHFKLLMSQMKDNAVKMDEVKEELKAKIDNIENRFDGMSIQVKSIETEQRKADKKVDKIDNELQAIKKEVETLNVRNNKIEQATLCGDLCIFNLPKTKNEDLQKMIKKLATLTDTPISKDDFVYIFAVPSQKDKKKS